MAGFLHGADTLEIQTGSRPVSLVRTAVIGIAGTASAGAINTPILVSSEKDFAQFGTNTPGTTILDALEAIFKQKGTVCVVINVLDPAKHATPAAVTAADINGSITTAGKRTGMKAFRDSFALFGFLPKILIAPVFSCLNTVSTELIATAHSIRAVEFHDAPIGITPQQAITGRGASGTINFNTSSERAGLCYPHVKEYDSTTNAEVLAPMSSYVAGALSRRDQENGFWWSFSNTEILGITGMERPIDAMLNDANCEANLLNGAGIITLYNSFGTGIRVWGNRSAAFPASTAMTQFMCVRRTADIIEESLEYYTLQNIDKPLDSALIDTIVESGNGYMRKLVGMGAILDGRCWFDATYNSVEELAAGHFVVSYDFLPPAPAERVTYRANININYLNSLLKAA